MENTEMQVAFSLESKDKNPLDSSSPYTTRCNKEERRFLKPDTFPIWAHSSVCA